MINQYSNVNPIYFDRGNIIVTSIEGKYTISLTYLSKIIGSFKHLLIKSHISGNMSSGSCLLSSRYIDDNMYLCIKFFDESCPELSEKEDVVRMVKMKESTLEKYKRIIMINEEISELTERIINDNAVENIIITVNPNGIKKIFKLEERKSSLNICSENEISSLTVKGCKNLKTLVIQDNILKKIGGLDILSGLTHLYLNKNKIDKIEGLEQLTNLLILNLSNNNIIKLENLNKLNKLEDLECQDNQISIIENLDELTYLNILNLSFNKIKKITGIQYCHRLNYIYLSNNKITTIENLEGLNELIKIDLDNNYIATLPDLSHLKNLSSIHVIDNIISKPRYNIYY